MAIASDRLYFDLTDLLRYMSVHENVTGIQRVILEVVLPALRAGSRGVILDERDAVWLEIDTRVLLAKFGRPDEAPALLDSSWASLSRKVQASARRIDLSSVGPRAALIVLGAHWGRDQLFLSTRNFGKRTNLILACLIHDAVPVNYPEYCINQGQIDDFKRWFASVIHNADVVITTARHNKHEIDRACSKLSLPQRHLHFCPLNGTAKGVGDASNSMRPEIDRWATTRFVLFVGTIEPRKDHLFIISCWRLLLDYLGPSSVPTLLLVGSLGWHYDAVVQSVNDPTVQNHVKILKDVTEIELEHLYASCMFVVYNSVHEGWGLPITESIARGKVPLVPNHSSLIEAGGDCAVYFEARSNIDFMSKAMRLIRDTAYREAATKRVKDARSLRDWADISRTLIDCVASHDARRKAVGPVIQTARIYRFANDISKQSLNDYATAESTRLYGWHKMEHWGCWTSDMNFGFAAYIDSSQLSDRVPIAHPIDDPYVIYVIIFKNYKDCMISYQTNFCMEESHIQVGEGRSVLQIALPAKIDGQLVIAFRQDSLIDLSEVASTSDDRTIGVGIEAVMACRKSDTSARLDLLEAFYGYKLPHKIAI